MINMITAQQARELSGPTPEEQALFFEAAIKEAASKGERQFVDMRINISW